MQTNGQYNSNQELLRETVGAFSEAANLETVITKLKSAGLQSTQLGLMAHAASVSEKLAHLYEEVQWDDSCESCPEVLFVEKDSAKTAVNAVLGGLGAVASAAAGGAIVASAAITAGPIGAAAAGATVVTTIGALAATLSNESDAQMLQSRLEEGQILLFVKPENAEQEVLVRETIDTYATAESELIEIKLQTH